MVRCSIIVFALVLPGVPAVGSGPGIDDPGGAWLSEVEGRIARAEYEITWQTATVPENLAASWHAPNRAQGFRTYFTEAGIRVVPRTAGGVLVGVESAAHRLGPARGGASCWRCAAAAEG